MTNYKKAVFALALSSFCMGVTEFVMAGVLIDIQNHFNIDAKSAGWLTTLYAIGVVVGALSFTSLLSPYKRHTQLIINISIFSLANLIIFFSDNFYLSAFARFIAGTQHGVFYVIATLAISAIAPSDKKSQAIAIMVTGLTVALVSGVPLGTFIGHYFGFKYIFLLIFILSIIALLGIIFMMPKNIHSNIIKFKDFLPAFSNLNLLKTYTISICGCGAHFILYTYLQKLLVEKSGFDVSMSGYILFFYGICAIFGNLWGGKMVDKYGAVYSLRIILSAQVLIYLSFLFTMHSWILVIISLSLIGFFSFSTISAFKVLSIAKAKRYTHKAQESTVSVNEASFNVGIALASFLGGLVLTYFGIEFNALFSAIFVLPALLFAFLFAKDKIHSIKRKA
ncbi:MFS transporter [Campylobacter peloridis]|uniref:MFS transporter n=1 Tax=Campylobacter peloridis TaxID=488546 RepID=A0ABX6TVZ5_9BACT|nr:MFS transporter [Campylobacter peloridis]AJC83958.1 major facilitator superfamily transporter [Campylobacter peloridis LMG 23910]MBX2079205.1 MFS transporter [Campylobacter peloridis]QOQ89551.1 MFS transporter [Campylobacter peloridis]